MSLHPPPTPFESFVPRFQAWRDSLHESGWEGVVSAMLDLTEPIAPVGASLLYVLQPVSGLFGKAAAVGDLAQVLELPGGVEWLRTVLDLDDLDPDPDEDFQPEQETPP